MVESTWGIFVLVAGIALAAFLFFYKNLRGK